VTDHSLRHVARGDDDEESPQQAWVTGGKRCGWEQRSEQHNNDGGHDQKPLDYAALKRGRRGALRAGYAVTGPADR
jgi:hypothetical protein